FMYERIIARADHELALKAFLLACATFAGPAAGRMRAAVALALQHVAHRRRWQSRRLHQRLSRPAHRRPPAGRRPWRMRRRAGFVTQSPPTASPIRSQMLASFFFGYMKRPAARSSAPTVGGALIVYFTVTGIEAV